jgi:hypothetical protein
MANSVSKPPSGQARRIWSDNPGFAPVLDKVALNDAVNAGKRKKPWHRKVTHRPPPNLDLIETWTPGKNWERID